MRSGWVRGMSGYNQKNGWRSSRAPYGLASLFFHLSVLALASYTYTKSTTVLTSMNVSSSLISINFQQERRPEPAIKPVARPIVKKRKAAKKRFVKKLAQLPIEQPKKRAPQHSLVKKADFDQVIIDYQKPRYPRRALRKRWEGTVSIRLFVDKLGKVLRVKVVQSSGREILDQAALNAAQKWMFKASKIQTRVLDKKIAFKMRS